MRGLIRWLRSGRLSLSLGVRVSGRLSLLLLLLLLLLGLLLGLTVLAIDIDNDCRWGRGPKDKACELSLCNGLLTSEKLRLQVEKRTGSEELAILLDEGCVTNEQVLVRKDDGCWVGKDLSIAGSLWCLRAKGKQD